MDNVKKLKLNSMMGLINQITILISGLILPRLILVYFGSEINGLTSSINQFLSIIRFLELGVGAVVQTALYKPIAKKNEHKTNVILASARQFFKRISSIFVFYVIALMFILPIVTESPIDYLGTSFLIFAMSISLFSQYYFGMVNTLLLNANQQNYLSMFASIITVTLNTLATVILIKYGASIQIVKLTTSLIYLLRPLFLKYYVERKYKFIDYDISPEKDAIPQKWNGMAQHVSITVMDSTDMIVLTLFSSLENVSVYAIHNLVVNGVVQLIQSTTSGIQSFFGNLLANDEISILNNYFTKIEWLIHTLITYIFGMTAVLLTPFVLIYTSGVEDANYNVPIFALVITIGKAIRILRLPYNTVILAGGHYKQTQNSSIIETMINIIVSLLAVHKFGLVGISLATIFALIYRQIYLIRYLSKNLIYRPINSFLKLLVIDIFSFSFIMILGNSISINPTNFLEWIVSASILGIIYAIFCLLINYIFYKDIVTYYLNRWKK